MGGKTHAYDLGQLAMVALNFAWHILLANERGTKKNERIRWTGYVGWMSLLPMGTCA